MSSPALRKLETFGSISDADKGRLVQILSVDCKEVAGKTDISAEGDNPASAHLLEAGLACRYKLLQNGRRQIVAFLVPGDFCDLHTFLLKSTDHSIGAVVPSRIAEIPKAHIDEIMEFPSLFKPMMISTLIDEATLREWITNIGQRPAPQRVAHLCCELFVRHERVGLTEGSAFEFPVTQVELGRRARPFLSSRQSVAKGIARGAAQAFKGKKIIIRDVEGMKRYCGFNPAYLYSA